jgi:hypothetical protein
MESLLILVDDNIAIGEITTNYCLRRFAREIIKCFRLQYLIVSNAQDSERILAMNTASGFPGMLGSVDCMH